jgi:hypothetical protein
MGERVTIMAFAASASPVIARKIVLTEHNTIEREGR